MSPIPRSPSLFFYVNFAKRYFMVELSALGMGTNSSTWDGSHKRHFALKTQKRGELFSMMHHVVMGDDPEVKKGKPSPDGFLAAARRFETNVDPSNVLVFEDAPLGVAAAKNAGMSVVMVLDPKLDVSYHKDADEDADEVLTSLFDFNPSNWGLPPFPDTAN